MANLLELRNVSKIFGGGLFNRSNVTIAVQDVSLAIPEDRPTITAIAGESGSGKTTLARLLLGGHPAVGRRSVVPRRKRPEDGVT